jgi:hypothetical protein
MRGNSAGRDPILEELHAIRGVLENLLILECARTGMKRGNLREIVGVDNNRISRIARHVRPTGKDGEED